MAVRALENSRFGFETSCFVCEASNATGLRLPFAHDEEEGLVSTEFTLGPEYSGAPRFVHGGLVMTILDEAMAWAVIAVAGRFGVVRHTSTSFRHGVMVGQPYRVEARLLGPADERTISTWGQVLDESGRACARSKAAFAVLSAETARSAIGDVTGDDTRYLRPMA